MIRENDLFKIRRFIRKNIFKMIKRIIAILILLLQNNLIYIENIFSENFSRIDGLGERVIEKDKNSRIRV